MTKKTLRVGMIGYRFMGKAHSNGWRQAPRFFPLEADLQLHTICGRQPKGVEAAARELGWETASTDWKAVIENPEIDIVDINTPNDSHAEIAIAAAKAGKHVLCEKPLALTVGQCREMLDAVQKNGVVHMVCHNYRRIPAIAHAKKMIEEGALGKLFHYRARYAQDWIVEPNFPLVWRLQKGVSGSGAHGDINAHIIDLGRYLVGEFAEVCGLMNTFIKQRPLEDAGGKGDGLGGTAGTAKMGEVTVDDAVMFIGRFENGALANLEATRFALGRKNNIAIEINGSQGSLFFDFEDMNRLQFFDNRQPEDRRGFSDILVTQPAHPYVGQWWPPGHILGYEHTFVHTLADFVNAVVAGQPIQPTFEDGLRNQQVLEAVEQSANSRQWTTV